MRFSILLCFLSSLFLILSFNLADFSGLAWISFVPLFFSLENRVKKQAFFLSYLWGLFFWAGLIYWLAKVTFLGYIFLVFCLSFYFGLFGILVSLFNKNNSLAQSLLIPSTWVFLEFLRTYLFTGFGWAILGYSQYKNLPLIQIADITGVYGVSFLIVLVNFTIYSIFSKNYLAVRKIENILFTLFFILLSLIYGYCSLKRTTDDAVCRRLRVSLIQANIPPYQKWDEEFKKDIFERYFFLTKKAYRDKPSLIIWPETSFPGYWEEEKDLRERVFFLAKELNSYILLGTPVGENNFTYNSAIIISPEGRELNRYYKIHLVPFGEYLPFPKIFGFLEQRFAIGRYTRGTEYTIFKIRDPRGEYNYPRGEYNFSVLICFEDIFPNFVRKFVKGGAMFLVNITEDGWYGETPASFQHAQATVFRAIENRRYLVRVANTGYSCIIDEKGRIVSEVKDEQGKKLFITKVHSAEIIPQTKETFYSLWGDWFVFICLIIILLGMFV